MSLDTTLFVTHYTWHQIVITLATGHLSAPDMSFPPTAKRGPFSRWAPLNSMKRLLITHLSDFLPAVRCCAKHDPFASHSPSTCFTCQLCLQAKKKRKIPLIDGCGRTSLKPCVICILLLSSSSRKQKKSLRKNSWGNIPPWPPTYTPHSCYLPPPSLYKHDVNLSVQRTAITSSHVWPVISPATG